MIIKGALSGAAPRRGALALRSAIVAMFSTAMLAMLALPASAAGRSAAREEQAGSFDLVVAGFAVLLMVVFAGAVLWYVARNRHSS